MNVASPTYTSLEEYLEAEASSDDKHEWCDGVVYAVSRGTPEQARLTARMIQERPFIEVYRREGDTWSCETADGGGEVTIHGAKIAVHGVYG